MAADAAIRIICPNLKCRTILSVPGNARGKSVRCRACGSRVSIPAFRFTKANAPDPAAATDGSTPAGT